MALRAALSRPQLRRLLDHIEAHLDGDQSLVRVADDGASHLRVLPKRAPGLPVHAYAIQRRVERAYALLAVGDRRAAEAALAAGVRTRAIWRAACGVCSG